MNPSFTDKDINSFSGEKALELLSKKNDSKFFEPSIGIKTIDKDRWLEAQEYERKTWCDSPAKFMSEDRHHDHLKYFTNYSTLNFCFYKDNLSLIELGCGPFTNLRFMTPQIRKSIKEIDLLDPLIDQYKNFSPNCAFKNNTLNNFKVNLINSSIEDYNFTKTYDLIVLVNVLEHCFDVDLIFEKINNIMDKDSILVFNDHFYKDENIEELNKNCYDAGHPLQISESYINKKLEGFKKLYYNYIEDEQNRNVKYLILKKK
jgi:SAM-dependent methyltransferase